ncbi:MAG: PAS domain S-box protein [Myxococcota bacterium]
MEHRERRLYRDRAEAGKSSAQENISDALHPLAEAQLAELESLYRDIPVGLCVVDRELRFLRANEAYARIVGRDPRDIIGRTMGEVVHERARAGAVALAQRVIDSGQPAGDVELPGVSREDPSEKLTWLVNVHPLESGGRVWGAVAVLQNVTAVKQAERAATERLEELESLSRSLEQEVAERKKVEKTLREARQMYQDLYDNAPDMYVAVDAATARILQCNHTVSVAMGYSREEILGRPLFEMYHPDCREDVDKAFRTFLETGEVRDAELALRRRDGTRLEVSLNASAVRDEAGRILRSRSVWRDISQRKRADRMQQLLIRELDHRVKNTLATVEAMADHSLTSSGSLEEFRGSFHGRIGAMARIHEELTRERMAGIDLRRLIEMAVAPFDQSADRRVSLAGPALVVPLEALRALGMALHELATNATKHGALSESRGRVEVSWQQVGSPPEARLVIRWVESGGRVLAEPSRRGFGTLFIEEGLEHELGAAVRIEFRPSGLRCEISVPLSAPEAG